MDHRAGLARVEGPCEAAEGIGRAAHHRQRNGNPLDTCLPAAEALAHRAARLLVHVGVGVQEGRRDLRVHGPAALRSSQRTLHCDTCAARLPQRRALRSTFASVRRFVFAAALVSALVAVPVSADAFTLGVSSAEVTSNSALLWTHAAKAGKVTLVVARDRRFSRRRVTKKLVAKKSSDLTVQSRVTRLQAGKRYYYFFIQGKKRSAIGTFATAPKPAAAKTIRFAVTGDSDPVRVNGHNFWNKDGSNDWATYRAMTREKNDFNVNLGDTIYSDAEL